VISHQPPHWFPIESVPYTERHITSWRWICSALLETCLMSSVLLCCFFDFALSKMQQVSPFARMSFIYSCSSLDTLTSSRHFIPFTTRAWKYSTFSPLHWSSTQSNIKNPSAPRTTRHRTHSFTGNSPWRHALLSHSSPTWFRKVSLSNPSICYGLFQYFWNPFPSCLSWLCFSVIVRLRTWLETTYFSWAHTVSCTFWTGFTDRIMRNTTCTTLLCTFAEFFRLCCTLTFSITTLRVSPRVESSLCLLRVKLLW